MQGNDGQGLSSSGGYVSQMRGRWWWRFKEWTGAVNSTNPNPPVLVMDGDKNVTGHFIQRHTVTADVGYRGDVDPDGGVYAHGQTVTFEWESEGFCFCRFTYWSGLLDSFTTAEWGAGTSESYPVTFTAEQDHDLVAHSESALVMLTANLTAPGCVDCAVTPDPQQVYLRDAEGTATATPGNGWVFVEWTGDDVPAGKEHDNPLTLTMDENKSVTAVMIAEYDLTATVDAEGCIGCAVDPEFETYLNGELATVTATVPTGWVFVEWTGDVPVEDAEENPLALSMDSDKAVEAVIRELVTLTASVSESSEECVSCTVLPASGEYVAGTSATITATAPAGWVFREWTGDVPAEDSAENPLVLVMDSDKAIEAVFEVELNILIDNPQTVTVNIPDFLTSWYLPSSMAELQATPAQGYEVAYWEVTMDEAAGSAGSASLMMMKSTGAGSATVIYPGALASFVIARPATARPVVREIGQFSLVVGSEEVGHVKVSANTSPVSGPTTLESGEIEYVYNQYADQISQPPILTEVTLEGVSDSADWAFDEWEGDIGGVAPDLNPLTLTMDQDWFVDATFSGLVNLTVHTAGEGTVSVVPDKEKYAVGEDVTLTATGTSGWKLYYWLDSEENEFSGWQKEITLTMAEDTLVTAVFFKDVNLTGTTIGPGLLSLGGDTPKSGTFTKSIRLEGDETNEIYLRAYPGDGGTFSGWSGDQVQQIPGMPAATIFVDSEKAVIATFDTLEVSFEEHSGQEYGFDDWTDNEFPWKSIAINDDDTVRALTSVANPKDVYFEATGVEIASVVPNHATTSETVLTVAAGPIAGDEGIVNAQDAPSDPDHNYGALRVATYTPIEEVDVVVRYVYLQEPDDIQSVPLGDTEEATSVVCVGPGANGQLESVPGGDDEKVGSTITVGNDRVCDTVAINSGGESPTSAAFPAAAFEDYLNEKVYNQCAVSFDVQQKPSVVIAYDVNPTNNILDKVIEEYGTIKAHPTLEEDVYHIFLIQDIQEGVAGFAPKGHRWVFVESGVKFSTIAHELGHAFGDLPDLVTAFPNEKLRDPENLMSYAEYHSDYRDYLLRKGQWDHIHDRRDGNVYVLLNP